MVKVAERMPRSGGVGVALGYSSTLYSVYSVTRPDARFWTTRAEPDHSRRYATIRKIG
jgi:hypothetical protein